MHIVFFFLLIAHGAIHLLPFLKNIENADQKELIEKTKKSKKYWGLAGIFLCVGALLFLVELKLWILFVLFGIALSQTLIIFHWKQAKFGTILNFIVALVLLVSIWDIFLLIQVRKTSEHFAKSASDRKIIVANSSIENLPYPVQKWLKNSGVVGKQDISVDCIKQKGRLRTEPNGKWYRFEALQWISPVQPEFIWFAKVSLFAGLFLRGIDKLENGQGSMEIRFLSVFPIKNVTGKEINQGASLRFLGEILWNPSASVEPFIEWENIDSITSKAKLRNSDMEVNGIFKFDSRGFPISFYAKRYFEKENKFVLRDWLVEIDSSSYKSFDGIKVPTKLKVMWVLPEGSFEWLEVDEVELTTY